MKITSVALTLAVAGFLGVRAHAGGILFVDDGAPLGGDGLTWDTAYRHLQDALADAEASAGTVTEIRVAQGVYKPDQDEAGIVTPGDREASFALVDGVALRGGFAGIGATDPDQQDPASHEAILSGDLAGDDDSGGVFENTYHVVSAVALADAEHTIVEGFTVTGGRADTFEPPHNRGGGLYAAAGSFTVRLCRFAGNQALGTDESAGGGAMYLGGGSPLVERCVFVENTALGRGGALLAVGADLLVAGCVFQANSAIGHEGDGGGVTTTGGNGVVAACLFEGNSAGAGGGGACNASGTLALANCLLIGNSSAGGGGVANKFGGYSSMVNCTVLGNDAFRGGGILADGGTDTVVVNSILWANTAAIEDQISGDVTVSFSDVQGGSPGLNNIDADPLLVDPSAGDCRLQGGSPCIDAGYNGAVPQDAADLDGDGDTTEPAPLDLDGNPRFADDPSSADCWQAPGECGDPPVVDMGAYEIQPPCFVLLNEEVTCHADGETFTYTATGIDGCTGGTVTVSFTASGGEVGEEACATLVIEGSEGEFCCTTRLCVTVPDCSTPEQICDLDGDNMMGVTDLLALLAAWGVCPRCPADLDGDGEVGIADLLALLAAWGPCP